MTNQHVELVISDVDPPPEDGGSRGVPTHPAPLASSASHQSIHSLVTESNGLSGRELCRAVLAEIEQRRLQKCPALVHFDGLKANRRRMAASVRLVGGDPDNEMVTPSRYHRPSTGLRASGFQEGFQRLAATVADDLRELYKVMEPSPDRDRVAALGRRYAGIGSPKLCTAVQSSSAVLDADLREAA